MNPEKLRKLYGNPAPRAAAKVLSSFDKHCRRFIENSTFVVIATSDGANLDVSPKGDPAGFVRVETEKTLLLPDRPGNNRIDGMINSLGQPKVSLIFLMPIGGETLRVNGVAEIMDDPALCNQFQVNNRSPKTVLRITAEEIYTHCGKAAMRADLWKSETWPTARPVPSMNEMVRDHANIEVDSIEQSAVEESYRKNLY